MRSFWLNRMMAKGRSLLGRSRDGQEQRRGNRVSKFDGGSSGDSKGRWARRSMRYSVDAAGLRMEPTSSRDSSLSAGTGGADLEISLLNQALPEYEILEMLDRGGQGTVYRAVQKSTGRLVALKVLHFDPHASRTRLQRFEREVALVARLRHPHVVTIYDRGLISNRPYLSMELIDGLPIDDYVLLNRPSVAECVALFEKVCRAVASVHQHGVIHRDLKPSNILVDLDGEPHILDFGLAKGFDDEPGESSLSTAGQVIGTLPYLSPEQAAGEEGGVDIRTDIYSLGVILHLLLTGAMPYSVNGSVDLVRRNITDQVPAMLERRGGTDLDDGAVGAISSDLSHIVLKTLAKDKVRRYQSADALADDLRRYLEGDVVAARGDGGWYLLRKTARRYRVHAMVAGAFLMLTIGSTIGMGVLWQRAEKTARLAQATLHVGHYVRHGGLNRDQGRIEQAIEMCEKALAIGLQIRDPDVEVHRLIYAAYHNLAQIYLDRPGKMEVCRRYGEAAVRTAETQVKAEPGEPEYRRLLAYACRLQGRIAIAEESWDEGQRLFRRSIEAFRCLPRIGDRIKDAPIQYEEEFSKQFLGRALLRGGERIESIEVLYDVCKAMMLICSAYPDSLEYLIGLIGTESLLAEGLLRGKTPDENMLALELLNSAESHLKQAFTESRGELRMRELNSLADAVARNRALALRRLERATQVNFLP